MTQVQAPLPLEQSSFILWNGIPVPPQFPYLHVLIRGRPHHVMDEFAFRHPPMERGKRAKIFSAFDALDGYGETIDGKNTVYTDRITPDESEKEELNRRLTILHQLTCNTRLAKANRVAVTVRYYVPCTDEYSFSRGIRGQYADIKGIVRKVDMENRIAVVGQSAISFDDMLSVAAENESVFARPGEES